MFTPSILTILGVILYLRTGWVVGNVGLPLAILIVVIANAVTFLASDRGHVEEAYPGDIFSVHARLLERATCLNPSHGGGSMTALPIVETMQGEIAAYIPTNVISITDGQIYLDQGLFASGFRPAIDIRRSVSRIGGQAQHPRIKAEAGRMKLDYLQFLELEIFTRFGARLEASMEAAIRRGRALREILKQERLAPLSAEFHMALLIAFNDGHFDNIREHDAIRESLAALEAGANPSSVHAEGRAGHQRQPTLLEQVLAEADRAARVEPGRDVGEGVEGPARLHRRQPDALEAAQRMSASIYFDNPEFSNEY